MISISFEPNKDDVQQPIVIAATIIGLIFMCFFLTLLLDAM